LDILKVDLMKGVEWMRSDFKFKFIFLCASHTLLHVYTNLPLALLPVLMKEYNLSVFIASLIVSIPRIIQLFFSLPTGLIADRLGYKRLISLSLFLEVLAAAVILFHPSIETIVLAFSLTALASTIYHPPALSAAADILPLNFRSRGLGFHGASGTLGVSLGPITLGLFLNHFGWRFVYLIWLIPILIAAFIALFIDLDMVREKKIEEHEISISTPIRKVFTLTFISLLLLMLFRTAAGTSISTYITTYLTEDKLLDPALASMIFGINPLIGLSSSIIGGYLGDRLGWKKSFTIIFSTVSIALFVVMISQTAFQAIAFYILYGFFNSMSMPISSSLVANIIPSGARGTAYSIYFIPMSLIGIAMPIILSFLIGIFNISVIFPIAIILYLTSLIIVQLLKING